MKKGSTFYIFLCLNIFFQVPLVMVAQSPTISPVKTTKATSFECELVLDIYNGLKDWVTGNVYSGGQLLNSADKKIKGAVTVVNHNNTDGDFNSAGSEIKDSEDNSVVATSIGRNEIDLIKLVIRKRNPSAPLSGGDIIIRIPSNVKLWAKPTKEVLVASPSSTITLSSSLFGAEQTYYAEAISPSVSIRDMKFEVEYNGNVDYALATAVWVKTNPSKIWYANATTPIPGPGSGPSFLTDADNENFYKSINTVWISENNQRYGFGPFFAGQPFFVNSAPHSLTPLLPGYKNKQIGGKILFEFEIFPNDPDGLLKELVEFDCARQKKAKQFVIEDLLYSPTSSTTIAFPFEIGKNVEEPNDDSNNITDEDREPKNSHIYSYDIPSSFIIEKDYPEFGFKMNQINFIEFVRMKIKGGTPFPTSTSTTGGNILIGSRCSENIDWHCFYYLRRGTADKQYVADNNVSSTSEPNKTPFFTGSGNALISTSSNAPSFGYILEYSIQADIWVLIDVLGEDSALAHRNSDGISWTIDHNGLNINIFEGIIPFGDADGFFFNTFNSLKKKNIIALGHSTINTVDP